MRRVFPLSAIVGMILVWLACAPVCPCKLKAPSQTSYRPQIGDLLFQDVDCGTMCDAIESVTHGVDQRNFSHVGILVSTGPEEPRVLEAVSVGVVEIPLSTFLQRSKDNQGKPKVWVGRVRNWTPRQRSAAARNALKHLGAPYDDRFVLGDAHFYCSELVYDAYRQMDGEALFSVQPMTFKNASGEIDPIWQKHFRTLGIPVPEGKPGLNPGSMSRNPSIAIVHRYGEPSE